MKQQSGIALVVVLILLVAMSLLAIVSLRGTLPDDNRKQLALQTAGKTEGVRRVIDLIKVKK